MKRSEINQLIEDAITFFNGNKFLLPIWGYYTPYDWNHTNLDYSEVKNNMLGWDVTDFGGGDFNQLGLLLFTIRNGNLKTNDKKSYAEKIMVVQEKQITPTHFHWKKMEDIINRGGGTLCIQLWKANNTEGLSDENFSVQIDGIATSVSAGDIIRLEPGQSITLEPFVYHTFWAENGKCMVGEVSQVNDDENDNRFLEPLGRFPAIEEDEEKKYLLCTEYPR